MVDKTLEPSAHDDAAFVDAYERRLAGGRPEDVPVVWREEIEQMVAIHERVAALPLPDVSPAVRSLVLTAAAQAVAQREVSIWSRVAAWLMKPGPILVAATAAALAVAVGVREQKTAPVEAGAVAMLEREPAPAAAEPQRAPPPAVAAAEAPPPAAAEPAATAPVPQAPAGGQPLQAALADESAAPRGRPSRAYAAEPASIAPESNAAEKLAPSQRQQRVAEDDLGQQQNYRAATKEALPSAPVMAFANQEAAKGAAADDAVDALAKDSAKQAEQKAEPRREAQKKMAADEESGYAQNNFGSTVALLRAEAEKTTDPNKKRAILLKLRAAALQAGDGKSAQWAEQALASQASGSQNQAPTAEAAKNADAAAKASKPNSNAGSAGVPAKAKAAPARAPAAESDSNK